MENHDKEVHFGNYCTLCAHETKDEDEEPCCYCLAEPSNTDSHKPVYFKAK